MDVRAFLAKIRDGRKPSPDDLTEFVEGMTRGEISDTQVAAFAMAACINGLDEQGRVALTMAMCDSGDRLIWDLPGPVLDQHSTGGVGDCTSLILVPALAACGAYVPMVSGRSLGYAGGTLNGLRGIPGLNVDLSVDRFCEVVREVGCAIVSTTEEISPADYKLLAIRDETSTIENMDLITASILSKKLATGIEGLVLDVKYGSGAFMKSVGNAVGLARALVSTANIAKCRCSAVVSDMNQPLARSVGGALEVAEAMRVLSGKIDNRLAELSCILGGTLLADSGLAENSEAGADLIRASLTVGRAAEVFEHMVAVMGGPTGFVENWRAHLPKAPVTRDVLANQSGFVNILDAEALGMIVVKLGGGRTMETDTINRSVGLETIARNGDAVEDGSLLARIHATDEAAAEKAEIAVRGAIQVKETIPVRSSLVFKSISFAEYETQKI